MCLPNMSRSIPIYRRIVNVWNGIKCNILSIFWQFSNFPLKKTVIPRLCKSWYFFALNVIFVHGMIEHVYRCTKPCLLHNLLKKYFNLVLILHVCNIYQTSSQYKRVLHFPDSFHVKKNCFKLSLILFPEY